MKAQISERGQVTIPKKLRERYGLREGVDVEFLAEEGGLKLRKVRAAEHPVDRVFGILKGKGGTDAYIEEIRGR